MKVGARAIAVAAALMPVSVAAQDAYKWSDIDCSQSRLVAFPGAKCRSTNVVSGGDTAGGQFQRWSIVGSQPYSHVYVAESLNSSSYIAVRDTGPDFLKWMNQRAKNSSAMTEGSNYAGATYYKFKSNDEDCVGFRRYGPSRSVGYAWIMGGVTCAPKGTALSQARITEFIDSARVK